MKRIAVLVIFLVISKSVFAYISGIAIQNDKRSDMKQVFVNGKLISKHPVNFVRIKSQPGLFHLQLKVLNPYNKVWYVVKKDVRLEKGLEFYYKVVFSRRRAPELREVRRYPVYSPYFLNPALYNRHPAS